MSDKMKSSWTPERRMAAALRCAQNKPWENATGPKTHMGKAKSSLNALKKAEHSQIMFHAKEMLKANKEFMKHFKQFNKLDLSVAKDREAIKRQNEMIKVKKVYFSKLLKKHEKEEMGRGEGGEL